MREARIVDIKDGGKVKSFQIKQMSATQLERWVLQFTSLLAKNKGLLSEFNVSEEKEMDVKVVFKILSALLALDHNSVMPLYNQMLSCVSHLPDKNNNGISTPLTDEQTIDAIIEDFETIIALRLEAVKLNLSFLDLVLTPIISLLLHGLPKMGTTQPTM